jgi:hypothetical protein
MAKTSTRKISQATRRCSKCPGRPPRAECIHTKVGLAFLASVNVRIPIPHQTNRPQHKPRPQIHPSHLRILWLSMYPECPQSLLQARHWSMLKTTAQLQILLPRLQLNPWYFASCFICQRLTRCTMNSRGCCSQ